MSAVPKELARHGITEVVDNVPDGYVLDSVPVIKWLLFDFGAEIREGLEKRCGVVVSPVERVEAVRPSGRRLSVEEEAQLLALLEKQAGRG